jgi:hypothetical protein
VPEDHDRVVVGVAAGARVAAVDVGQDLRHGAEQLQGLVDQVGAQVEEDAAAVGDAGLAAGFVRGAER